MSFYWMGSGARELLEHKVFGLQNRAELNRARVHQADVNVVSASGQKPIHLACLHDDSELVCWMFAFQCFIFVLCQIALLIEHKASPTEPNRFGVVRVCAFQLRIDKFDAFFIADTRANRTASRSGEECASAARRQT